jgi:internalin A
VEDFRYLRFLEFSARTDLGLEVLFAQIKESIRALLTARPPQSIGLGRRMVRDRLREMLHSGTTRVLDRSEFAALCAATGKVSNPDALLGFLHHAGVVFHRPDLFEDRIILDQTWALDAIYTLFHRQDTLPFLFRDGRFTRELLGQLAWKDKPLADQVVLLGMMESCGICFRAGNLAGEHEAPVWEYVAPDLLPEWSNARARLLGRFLEGEPDDQVTVRFTFLHEGILRAFLSRVGRLAGEAAVYWKYGCWFAEERANATILVQGRMELDRAYPGKGEITLQSWGAGASRLLDQVLRLVLEIRVGQPPEVLRRAEILKPYELDALSDSKGGDELRAVRRDQMPDDGKRRVHLSYAWGDTTPQGRQREELVNHLCDHLREWGYDVLRDKDILRSGEAISDFMRSIGQSERVLVVLSEKYLRSVYCMTELHEIYRNSRGEKDDFLRRIIPLTLDDARIGSAADRGRHALYWKRQREELQPLVAEGVLGETDLAQWCRMARWVADVSEMLAHINDTLHAVGFDAILADDFAGVRERLQRRE